jgi:hypothetical protein
MSHISAESASEYSLTKCIAMNGAMALMPATFAKPLKDIMNGVAASPAS